MNLVMGIFKRRRNENSSVHPVISETAMANHVCIYTLRIVVPTHNGIIAGAMEFVHVCENFLGEENRLQVLPWAVACREVGGRNGGPEQPRNLFLEVGFQTEIGCGIQSRNFIKFVSNIHKSLLATYKSVCLLLWPQYFTYGFLFLLFALCSFKASFYLHL